MDYDYKSVFKSTTMWGIAVSMLFKVAAIMFPGRVDPGLEAPAQQIVLLLVSFVGDVIAAIGRWKADTKLSVSGS